MPIEIILTLESFKRWGDHSNIIDLSSPGTLLYFTHAVIEKDQVITPIYLIKTDNIVTNYNIELTKHEGTGKFETVLSLPDFILKIGSLPDKIIFFYEELSSPYRLKYKQFENKIYPFLVINRNSILSFEKQDSIHYNGVKAKTSLKVGHDTARGGIHGMVGRLLITSAIKLANRIESDFEVKEGFRFKLSYLNNANVEDIYIACDKGYVDDLEDYLSKHWAKIERDISEPLKEKKGCFIATACYGSYDHPSVKTLRRLRDNLLLKSRYGENLVHYYYKASPALAEKLKTKRNVAMFVKLFILTPIVFLTDIGLFLTKRKHQNVQHEKC